MERMTEVVDHPIFGKVEIPVTYRDKNDGLRVRNASGRVTLDGYIRVSRVGGRKGDSFLSPTIQQETIERLAVANGLEIGEIVREMDVSGSKAGDDRELGRLVRKIENGESGGLLVWKVSRFSRSLADGVVIAQRIREAGGRLIGSDLDTGAPMGKALLGFLLGWAEEELDARTESWLVARTAAVGRGVHVASKAPTGYRRGDDGVLVRDQKPARAIAELFRRRARGDGWTALAKFLTEKGVVSPYGNSTWSPSAVANIIRNRVYLGEARSGDIVNPHAHDPIVLRAEWEAAQLTFTVTEPEKRDALLLSGLVRCASCRYTVKPDRMTGRKGEHLGLYRCRGRHAAGVCPSPTSVLARVLDPYVEHVFLDQLASKARALQGSRPTDELNVARQDLADAEFELSEYLEAVNTADIGREAYAKGARERQARIDTAVARLADVQRTLGGPNLQPQHLLDAWDDLDVDEKREILVASIDCVVVFPVRGSGKQVPVEDRALIVWHGQAPADLPGRGKRVDLEPWPQAV
jgi:DNA invertase Pin-like site-specific DNA recombinase